MLVLHLVFSVSVDCPDMITLGSGLGIQTKQPSIWSALKVDCCGAVGVVCTAERITQVQWATLGLNGTINETAIPPLVTDVFLENNLLPGKIPTMLSSRSIIRNLRLFNNKFNGSIPLALIPSVRHLYLHSNQLTGTIPALPNTLQSFSCDGNRLVGDLPKFPNSIVYIALGYSNNPGNYFTGTLSLNRPFNIWINDNWITDINIRDTSQIDPAKCDLSNNPLLGNPNIANLTMCTVIGLYSANDLPNTIQVNPTTSTATGNSISPKDSIEMLTSYSNIRDETTSINLVYVFGFPLTPRIMQLSQNAILKLVFRQIVDLIILIKIISKTPFKREIKKIFDKKKESFSKSNSVFK